MNSWFVRPPDEPGPRKRARSIMPRKPLEERFWPKVEKTFSCWIWTAGKNNKGYGMIWDAEEGRQVLAHRASYQMMKGPIPEGLSLDHLCRNPACVNPDHLEPVTHKENLRRGNTPGSLAARTGHCKRGHSDWRWSKDGKSRHCRTCARERNRARSKS